MPIIQVSMFKGRTKAQKAAMVEKMTDAFVETTGARREVVEVLINEYEQDNWALGGTLFADQTKHQD